MNTDLTTRILLAGILLCLAVLVVGGGTDRGSDTGRFQVDLKPGKKGETVIIRTDTTTGQVWHSVGFPSETQWVAFPELGEGNPPEAASIAE
jgi:hypothetical protein